MPPKPKGSSNAIPKHIRFNPDLLQDVEAAMAEDGMTNLTAFVEDALRLKLEQRRRRKSRQSVADPAATP